MPTGSLAPSWKEKLAGWIRRDWLALLLFALAVVVMTYPLAFRPGQGLPGWRWNPEEAHWVIKGDTLSAQWQVWWLEEVVKNGYNPNRTPYLSYPNGLDVTFNPRRWAAFGVWIPLRALLGGDAGFNVSVIVGLFASAYAAYLLIHYLTNSRAAAWIGGAFYAFYPAHLNRALQQPNTGSIQWIPLFMLALIVGLRRVTSSENPGRQSTRQILLAMGMVAVALSLNIYITIKPWIQAALLGAIYVSLMALIEGWWKDAVFWKALGFLAIGCSLLALPVLAPYFLTTDSARQHALDLTAGDLALKGVDILAFVKASPEYPLFMPRSLARLRGMTYAIWEYGNSFYLGLTSIVLAFAGLVNLVKRDRRQLVWLAMALVFWILSLGTVLWIGTNKHPGVWLPYRLLEHTPLFKAVRTPHRFTLGFSVAWAVLVGYGVAHILQALAGRKRLAHGLVAFLCGLMLFEFTEVPIPLVSPGVSPFYYQLRAESEGGAIIDVGKGPTKRLMYLQTIHHRPIHVGHIGRLPEGSYDYVEANPLLQSWLSRKPLTCSYDVAHAISDLYDDGFRYVVVHKNDAGYAADYLEGYFLTAEPLYDDKLITAYTLAELQANPPCP